MDFPERSEYIADMFQEMICVDDGKLVVIEGPRELIEIMDDIDSGKRNPVYADAAWGLAPAAPDV
jgi:hypothetical protein